MRPQGRHEAQQQQRVRFEYARPLPQQIDNTRVTRGRGAWMNHHPTVATPSATATLAAARARPRRARRRAAPMLDPADIELALPESDSSLISTKSTRTSAIVWNRFAGSLRRHRRIVRSRLGGTDGTSVVGGFG